MFKLLILALFSIANVASKYNCNDKSALLILKRPTYEFSVKLLDRVAQDTDGHFVFSPIATYMQLLAIAEGAKGKTSRELWKVTKHHRLKCFRRKWRQIINRMDITSRSSKRKSWIVMDRFMNIKPTFISEIKVLKATNVLLLDFTYPDKAADIANKLVSSSTGGVIQDAFTTDDFNSSVLLMADTSYYSSDWRVPFNPALTAIEPFYSEQNLKIGEVKIMSRMDYFHVAEINLIKAKVLELPCADRRVSMLIFMPTNDASIMDLYYNLQRIRLMSIFNTFKLTRRKLVTVKLPRFKITTDLDNMPAIVYDMGVKSLFYPNLAKLKGISDFKMYASLMTQVADIEVTERGVRAGAVADFLVSDRNSSEFVVNRPFAYMLVDRITEVILFAGMYNSPEVF